MSLEKLLKRIPVGLTALVLSCGSGDGQGGEGAGCTSDYDCKGERICSEGQCTASNYSGRTQTDTSPKENESPPSDDYSSQIDTSSTRENAFPQECLTNEECNKLLDSTNTGNCNLLTSTCCYGSFCSAEGVCKGLPVKNKATKEYLLCLPPIAESGTTILLKDEFDDESYSKSQWDICNGEFTQGVALLNYVDGCSYNLVTSSLDINKEYSGYSLEFKAKMDSSPLLIAWLSFPATSERAEGWGGPTMGVGEKWSISEDTQEHNYKLLFLKKSPSHYYSHWYEDGVLFFGIDIETDYVFEKYPDQITFECFSDENGTCAIDEVKLNGFD